MVSVDPGVQDTADVKHVIVFLSDGALSEHNFLHLATAPQDVDPQLVAFLLPLPGRRVT